MKKLLQNSGFDELDRAILEELQVNGRTSNADLARKIHLSQPAVHNRIKRLEKRGIIQQYVALLDRETLGYDLLCFVYVTLDSHSGDHWQTFHEAVQDMPQVLECYRLTGDDDVMLKTAMPDAPALDAFIHENINNLPGVCRVRSNIVLNEIKSSTAYALR